jgi:hypothetical protein
MVNVTQGDVVLIPAIVHFVCNTDRDGEYVTLKIDNGFGTFSTACRKLNIHSVLPRPLKVGDRVVFKDDILKGNGRQEMIILAIDPEDGTCWCRTPQGNRTCALSDLKQVTTDF